MGRRGRRADRACGRRVAGRARRDRRPWPVAAEGRSLGDPSGGCPCMNTLELDDLCAAARRISGFAERTPVVRAVVLPRLSGTNTWLKLETVQPTGSFKVRGAANALLALVEAGERPRGVVT